MRSQPARRAKSVLVDCVRRARLRPSAMLAGGALALASGSATAENRRPIDEGWPSDWVRIDPGEGAGVAAAAALAIASATASDLGYFGLPLYQVLVEAGLVAWLGYRSAEVLYVSSF